MIYLGADHRGFGLKEKIKLFLQEEGIPFEDMGAFSLDPKDDYPDFAHKVAEAVKANPQEYKGILLCGSGVGVDVVANKEQSIISGLFFNAKQAKEATAHDHVNIASLPADYLSEEETKAIVRAFLKTPYSQEERHERRVKEIKEIEKE